MFISSKFICFQYITVFPVLLDSQNKSICLYILTLFPCRQLIPSFFHVKLNPLNILSYNSVIHLVYVEETKDICLPRMLKEHSLGSKLMLVVKERIQQR